MPLDKLPVEGRVTVEKERRGEVVNSDTKTQPVGEVVSRQPLCNVGYKLGRTKNLGAGTYESARIDVSLNVPCCDDEVDAAFDAAEKWVHEKMGKVFEDLGLVEE